MERRAHPRRRPDTRKRLLQSHHVAGDSLASDASDSKDEHSSDDDAMDEAASIVVSRVHTGMESLVELHRGRGRVRCDRIVQMNVFGNRIATLDGLHRFTQLQELCLSNNRIEELSFHELDPLKLLRVLDLSANQLSSLRGLPLLPRLEELSIAHNRLTGLEGLLRPVKLPKLRYMDVRGNQLASPMALLPLQHLKRLAHLRLQSRDGAVSNPICDLKEYPEALLEFLPMLKQLDEECVTLLRELSRVRMPKYHSAARRIQNQSAVGVDGSSQTTPGKPPTPGDASGMRVFAESGGRMGYQVTRNDSQRQAPVAGSVASRMGEGPEREAATLEKMPQAGSVERASTSPIRVVLREMSTNTELDFERTILDRETLILEKQAAMLAQEQAFLRRETKLFAKEKELQDTIRTLQGQLTCSLEQTAKLEAQVTQNSHEWEAKVQELERRRTADSQAEAHHKEQLEQLRQKVEQLERANKSLSTEVSDKENLISQLKQDSARIHLEEATSVNLASTNAAALEAALKEATERCRTQENQLTSHQITSAAQVEKLTQQLHRLDLEYKAQTKQDEEAEKRLQEMKASRDHFRDECLHKDDELYRLKKALLHKSEEVEEVRVQLMKAAERQDRMQLQQQQLYDKQLQASVVQLEMEFRREHHQATDKLQSAYRKYQDTMRQLHRLESAYESSLKREALLKDEVQRLTAIVEGDKQKLVNQELTKRAEYEFKIQRLRDENQVMHDELLVAREDKTKIGGLHRELDESKDEQDRLRGEIKHLEDAVHAFEAKEGDYKAALKVKDTMLNDQLRQLETLRKQNKTLEDEYQQDTGEFQGQIEDLEEALDESLQKVSKLQEKYDRAKAALVEREENSFKHSEKLDDLGKEIELKNAALELIESEMDRMRDTLSKQDEIFQKRLQKHLEQHREEMSRARVSIEEADAKMRAGFEAQRTDMMAKYEKLAEDLKDMAAQNTKLRVTLDHERKKNLQSDREMRVLLAQLDRERHIKNERLDDIKRLFEQLQQETP